jgi:hypothetical protein
MWTEVSTTCHFETYTILPNIPHTLNFNVAISALFIYSMLLTYLHVCTVYCAVLILDELQFETL